MEEPSALMRWTVFVFAGGDAGICGAISVATLVILYFSPARVFSNRPVWMLIGISAGLLLMACGSMPMPIWFQLVTLAWLILALSQFEFRTIKVPSTPLESMSSKISKRRRLLLVSAIIWLTMVTAFELPFHFPSAPIDRPSTLLVIGDSVTAGLNDGEETWPILLSRVAKLDVLDASQPGATLRSAKRQNEQLSGPNGVLVLEIGGNDMLEGLPVAKFEDDLHRLLNDAVQPGRTVLMFELPLPPFCGGYGLAQRRQAGTHHVTLIPKRLFANLLTTKGATVDGIHLSSSGQRQMMQLLKSFLGDRLVNGAGTFQRAE